MCVNDEGAARRVHEVCAKLYAVKEVAGVLGDEMRVGLHHVGKKRLKSAKMEVDITPFVKGTTGGDGEEEVRRYEGGGVMRCARDCTVWAGIRV